MLEFNEELHQYMLDGKKLISTTQLMRKHGLAPNYDGVSPDVLKRKAERGTLIHKEIENFIKNNENGFSEECDNFSKYIKENNIIVKESEYMVNNDIVAGTIDLILDGNIIADIKTTYKLHIESVSWQLSIYLYLYVYSKKELFKWEDWKGQAFHFHNGELNVVEIQLKPIEAVRKLMECEREGKIFDYEILNLNDSISKITSLEQTINFLDEQVKKAKLQQEEFKNELLRQMQERKLTTYEKNGVKITVVKPEKTITTIDKEKMDKEIVSDYEKAKSKYDEEAKKYTTVSKIQNKPYLRITLKEKKNNE